MAETNFNKQRIAKNTTILALRMLFTMWINLYITRLVLQNLGIEDYGTYGIVGGVVTMFTIFSKGLANAVNRFITYELGRTGSDIQKTFCCCVNIVFIFAILSFIIFESIGVWFLNNKINIPEESISSANWVFQFSIITCIVNMISIPYNALIIAHEKMNAFAYISIIQVLLNLAAAYIIGLQTSDRLLFYGLYLAVVSISIRIIYQSYCRRKFQESKYKLIIDKAHMMEIGKFTGYSMLDGILVLTFSQGFNILLNMNFGVAMNGVFTIATQVRNSTLAFSQNVQKAIEPQIIKTYSNREYNKSIRLIVEGSRMQAYLLMLFAIPIWVRSKQILSLWLDNVPVNTETYVGIFICVSIIYAITCPVITGALATGKIKNFLIGADFIYILSICILYIISYLMNVTPILFALLFLLSEIIIALYRFFSFSRISSFSFSRFMISGVAQPVISIVVIYYIMVFINSYFEYNLFGLIKFVTVSWIITVLTILTIGLNTYEKKFLLKTIKKKILCKD